MTKQSKIFISYGRKDDYLNRVSEAEEHTYHLDPKRSFTRQVYTALSAAGFDVWWDRECMPNRGEPFLQEIKQAVHDCDFLVYVAGDHAFNSPYVRAEWEYALSICKPVIPVLRNGTYETTIPPEIGMGNAPDMRDMKFFDAKIAELIRLCSDNPRVAKLHSVPNLPDWYVERGNDVQDLQADLRADSLNPIVVTSKQQTLTLQGMGGLGKTTLATALCRLCDVRYSFHDGVFWVEIGKNPSLTTRQGDIGIAFGDVRDEYPDEQRGKSRLSALLQDKSVLIVLDDVWDYRHVEAFRVNAPKSRILVTTRIGRISTQLGVSNHEIDTLTQDEGVALIGKRLKRDPEAENPYLEDEGAIVDLLGGHTLAISIAAAKIKETGGNSGRFRQRLEARRAKGGSPLGDLNMHDDDKNYNLELSLVESYEDLSETQQAQFRALGAFAHDGTFDLAAAQYLWQLDDEFDAEDALTFLLTMSLLTEPETGRYQLHNLLHDYARALATSDEVAEYQARHFAYYHQQHSDYDLNQTYADDGSMLTHDQIEADWENIQTALAWGFANESEKAIDWVNAVKYFMLMRRSNDERLKLLQQTLGHAEATEYTQGQANTLQALGDVHLRKNEYEEAVGRYQAALPVYEAIGDRLGQANTLQALGDVHLRKNEYEEAVGRYQAALPVYEAIGDRLGQANTLQALGDVHLRKNEYEEAVGRYQAALPVYEAIGDRLGQANTLKALGDVHLRKNEYEEAVGRYQAALPVYEAIGDRLGQANTLKALGDVHRMKNEYEEAVGRYQAALPVYEAIGARLGQANTLQALGDVHRMKNEYEEAVGRYQAALPVYEAIGDRLGQANTLQALGDVHLRKNEYEEAVGRYQAALPVYEAIGDRLGQANTLKALGDVHRMKNEYEEAVGRYQAALHLGREIGDLVVKLNCLQGLGRVAKAQGDIDAACEYYRQRLALADTHPYFKNSPTTQAMREEFAEWGCL